MELTLAELEDSLGNLESNGNFSKTIRSVEQNLEAILPSTLIQTFLRNKGRI